ncbi:hypothetical protein D9M69_679320 [compost metagenome]
METALTLISAVLLCAVVFYVQKQIPFFTKGGRIVIARAILLAVGVGFGLTAAANIGNFGPRLPAFLIGFGLVHVPAAIILFIKARRGEGKS